MLLLDEWDANLDPSAMDELSGMIDRLSEGLCIVEVRHRTDERKC